MWRGQGDDEDLTRSVRDGVPETYTIRETRREVIRVPSETMKKVPKWFTVGESPWKGLVGTI